MLQTFDIDIGKLTYAQQINASAVDDHRGGGHLYFRLDIIRRKRTLKTHPNHVFFRYENKP